MGGCSSIPTGLNPQATLTVPCGNGASATLNTPLGLQLGTISAQCVAIDGGWQASITNDSLLVALQGAGLVLAAKPSR